MSRLSCWFGAHEDVRRHAPHRVFLCCTVCGRETPGLRDDNADVKPPRVIYAEADPGVIALTHDAKGKLTRGAWRAYKARRSA